MGELEKLKIIPLKKNIATAGDSIDLDTGNEVVCHYNPETLSLSKSYTWTQKKSFGSTSPKVVFSGGNAGNMSLELLFDTTKSGKKVTDSYYKLVEIAAVKPSGNKDGQGAPRQVVVHWGKFLSYVSVIESLSQSFSLFLPDGTPLRAHVTISLREVVDKSKMKPQNPTSRSDVRQTWVVEKGQRIEWIAHSVYGNTDAWRHLAETNDLMNPAVLRPGQILKITPL